MRKRGRHPKFVHDPNGKHPETKYSPYHVLRFEGEDFVEKSAGTDEILSAVEKSLK